MKPLKPRLPGRPVGGAPAPVRAPGLIQDGNMASYNALADRRSGKGEAVEFVPMDLIRPSRFQTRQHFNEATLQSLGESLGGPEMLGLIQPPTVRRLTDSDGLTYYELVAGERRWRGARLMGYTRMKVVVREMSDAEAAVAGAVENLERDDLDAWAKANTYAMLRGALERELGRGRVGADAMIARYNPQHEASQIRAYLRVHKAITRKLLLAAGAGIGEGEALDETVMLGLTVTDLDAVAKRTDEVERLEALRQFVRRVRARARAAVPPDQQSLPVGGRERAGEAGAGADGEAGSPDTQAPARRIRSASQLLESGGFRKNLPSPVKQMEPAAARRHAAEVGEVFAALSRRAGRGGVFTAEVDGGTVTHVRSFRQPTEGDKDAICRALVLVNRERDRLIRALKVLPLTPEERETLADPGYGIGTSHTVDVGEANVQRRLSVTASAEVPELTPGQLALRAAFRLENSGRARLVRRLREIAEELAPRPEQLATEQRLQEIAELVKDTAGVSPSEWQAVAPAAGAPFGDAATSWLVRASDTAGARLVRQLSDAWDAKQLAGIVAQHARLLRKGDLPALRGSGYAAEAAHAPERRLRLRQMAPSAGVSAAEVALLEAPITIATLTWSRPGLNARQRAAAGAALGEVERLEIRTEIGVDTDGHPQMHLRLELVRVGGLGSKPERHSITLPAPKTGKVASAPSVADAVEHALSELVTLLGKRDGRRAIAHTLGTHLRHLQALTKLRPMFEALRVHLQADLARRNQILALALRWNELVPAEATPATGVGVAISDVPEGASGELGTAPGEGALLLGEEADGASLSAPAAG